MFVMHKNEHPNGSYPDFRALGKRAIKENLLEEAGLHRLKVGEAGWWQEGCQPRERERGERGKWILSHNLIAGVSLPFYN